MRPKKIPIFYTNFRKLEFAYKNAKNLEMMPKNFEKHRKKRLRGGVNRNKSSSCVV